MKHKLKDTSETNNVGVTQDNRTVNEISIDFHQRICVQSSENDNWIREVEDTVSWLDRRRTQLNGVYFLIA
jgi:hypothetical protein